MICLDSRPIWEVLGIADIMIVWFSDYKSATIHRNVLGIQYMFLLEGVYTLNMISRCLASSLGI